MTDTSQFFQFRAGVLTPIHEASALEVQLEVADSWLVEDGKCRSLRAHLDRFSSWVTEISPACEPSLEEFFRQVIEKIPPTGRWFPRIEFHAEAESPHHLYLRLREAPDQLGEVILWTLPEPDPRINPTVKGPDLSLGMQMRRNAKMHGADEAVILDADGFVLEGALSALVWWRGETLCSSSENQPWLPSVTREEVFSIAKQMGYATKTEKVKPSDLVGLEIWALSSLQGIRVVCEWIDLGAPVGRSAHFEAFNRRLRMLSTSIYQ
jgi:branched-subunit amino acid aminotransferase/4-amino-4-deoxychorismate lyase